MIAVDRRVILAPLALLCVVVLSACGTAGFSGLYNAPLPGGADLGDDPYRVSAEFTDVLDLVPQASVRVNDVSVGRVDRVELAEDTESAVVTMTINGDVDLPANADAALRQSSLMGEKFVELRPPEQEEAHGSLSGGETIPLARTNRGTELEEVLGALSLLLSGGGIEQIQTIAEEVNAALSGNEAEVKALLSHAEELTRSLDGQKNEIVRAIDGLNELSTTLNEENDHLEQALEELEPGLRVVSDQQDEIVTMLGALDDLSGVTVETIEQSRDELVANLEALEPTVRKLAEAGTNLPEALKILPTYPLPWNANNVVKGDFSNVHAEFDLNLDKVIDNIRRSNQPPLGLYEEEDIPSIDELAESSAGAGAGAEDSPEPPELPLPSTGDSSPGTGGESNGVLDPLLGGR